MNYIHTGNEDDVLFVLWVLRNYEGEDFTHELLKSIVEVLPVDSELLGEVRVAFLSTGVVSGEYGFANAYEGRLKGLENWKSDKRDKVRAFANIFAIDLAKQIEDERNKVKVRVALEKHEYGELDDDWDKDEKPEDQ